MRMGLRYCCGTHSRQRAGCRPSEGRPSCMTSWARAAAASSWHRGARPTTGGACEACAGAVWAWGLAAWLPAALCADSPAHGWQQRRHSPRPCSACRLSDWRAAPQMAQYELREHIADVRSAARKVQGGYGSVGRSGRGKLLTFTRPTPTPNLLRAAFRRFSWPRSGPRASACASRSSTCGSRGCGHRM